MDIVSILISNNYLCCYLTILTRLTIFLIILILYPTYTIHLNAKISKR